MASLFQGKFHTNAEIDASGLIFPAIRMSSGRLEVKRLILQITGFIGNQNNGNGSGKPAPTRYPEQFDLHAHDWTFTQDDLMESRCIRNGLKNLLVRILQDKGVRSSSIEITSIDILVRLNTPLFFSFLFFYNKIPHSIYVSILLVLNRVLGRFRAKDKR